MDDTTLQRWKIEAVYARLAAHLITDVRLDASSPGGYTPSADVLASRERHWEYEQVCRIGMKIRDDFWADWAGDRGPDTLAVGFRDNRDAWRYRDGLRKLAAELAAAPVSCLLLVEAYPGGYMAHVELDSPTIAIAKELHARYVAAYTETLAITRAMK